MSERSRFGLSRMSPLQIGLLITTILVTVAVVALLLVTVRNTADARMTVESGYIMTDLARIQRGISRLQAATDAVLLNPDEDLRAIDTELALLSNQLRMASGEAAYDPVVASGLGRARNILVQYNNALIDLRVAPTAERCRVARDEMVLILLDMEQETQGLYDQQETIFFSHVSTALRNQRISQVVLLGMGILLMVFGVSLAASLRRSVSFEFDRAYNMLEALFRADEDMHRHLEPTSVFQALVDVCVDMLDAQKAALMVWDEKTSRLVCQVARGCTNQTIGVMSFGQDEGRIGEAYVTGQTILIEDTLQDPNVSHWLVTEEGVRSLAHVPIEIAGKTFGVLSICYTHTRTFDDDDRRLARALAQRASSAIENARLYEQLGEAATLEERQRLARELHDAVTQTLFSASLIADVLPRIWERSPEMGRARLEELRELTRGALAEMRTLLLELRPQALIDASLGDLLKQLAEAVTGRSRIPVALSIHGEETCILTPEVKVAIYRIAQEALNNIAKHARATQARISLDCVAGGLSMVIEDNGRGFDQAIVPANHLGLGIMNERARAIGATARIESQPGLGTRVEIDWRKDEQ